MPTEQLSKARPGSDSTYTCRCVDPLLSKITDGSSQSGHDQRVMPFHFDAKKEPLIMCDIISALPIWQHHKQLV